jgi:hypothetical protein
LELKQIKLYLQKWCKELVKFYLQRFIYRLYQLNILIKKLDYMNPLIETLQFEFIILLLKTTLHW